MLLGSFYPSCKAFSRRSIGLSLSPFLSLVVSRFWVLRVHRCVSNIDFKGNEYLLRLEGDWKKLPDLTQFPLVEDHVSVIPIPHSQCVHELWTSSQVLKYGADAHIRVLNSCSDEFHICKVAINDCQKRILREEFSIIRSLSSNGVPVVGTHHEPLSDEQGIFGFRMERLVDIDLDNATPYIPEIARAIENIHRNGVVHYDIGPSNIMLDSERTITFIDFGRAGYIGQKVPSYKSKDNRTPVNETFSVTSDDNALKKRSLVC